MKLLIFGATGSVGRELVSKALQQGYEVYAFGRAPEKLPHKSSEFHFIKGDVFNQGSVEIAVSGKDAVVCVLGDGRVGKVRYAGTKNIVDAMHRQGVKRIICQTTLGCGDSEPLLNFFWRRIMFGWFLKKAFIDHERQEAIIKASQLDWTIIRPAAFTNVAETGQYQEGQLSASSKLSLKIGRKDLASFMLQQLISDRYLQATAAISY